MRVKRLREAENFYEVYEGSRWWTVNMDDPSNPYILNENSVEIKPSGSVGKKIMTAVNAYRSE